jgi:signal transduction histidine kinase
MAFTFSYLYFQYRYPYLAIWSIAWILHDIRIIFFEKAFVEQSSILASITYCALSVCYALFMAGGTASFQGKNLDLRWVAGGIVCLGLISAGLQSNAPMGIYFLPGVLFVGSIYIATGFAMRKLKRKGPGRDITAGAFILLGIHTFDMPFLLPIVWFAPWGYLLDGILRFIASIGILFVYFENLTDELTRLEEDIARLNRLNTAGQMAASFAHEIRNPLTTIRGYLQLFANKQEFHSYIGHIGIVLDELDRTNTIISEYR